MAEGSFANDKEKVIVEQGNYIYIAICTLSDDLYGSYFTVHLRKRQSEHGRLKAPSTSSITYWQIEKDAEPLSGKLSPLSIYVGEGVIGYCALLGQTVNWGERCRIKHLPTRLYLAVIKNESNNLQV